MTAARKFIVGNWKMNGMTADLAEAKAISEAASECLGVDVAICPPATLLAQMKCAAPTLTLGAQDCNPEAKGAFTGSISAAMLAEAGASLVIVGHSERREGQGETDAMVRAKATAALQSGLSVILCVGEAKPIRDAGDAEAFVTAQLHASLPDLSDRAELAVAYEPIWAIGTGVTPTVSDVATMHATIRALLVGKYGEQGNGLRILYGGSVTGDNAAALLGVRDVDGALVGGASLTAAKFNPIVSAAATL